MNFVRWLRSLSLLLFILGATIPSAAQTIDELKKGVVKITAQTNGMAKVGTGFIVRLEQNTVYVLTAAHVVEGDPKPQLTFYTRQDTQYPAAVRNAEGKQEQGLAIVVAKVPPDVLPSIAALGLDTTTKLSGGEDMLTIGFPRTGGQWAVIKGDVTSREGRNLNLDANIQEGNSGGPIIHNGKVVGLVTARGSNYGSGVTAASAQDYLEGFNVTPQAASARASGATASVPVARQSVEPPPSDRARQITGKDGAPMVLIPAGSFQMGSTKDEVDRAIQTCLKEYKKDQQTCEGWYKGELPQHRVQLDAFYLDKYEVTNRLFHQFVQQTSYRTTAEQNGSAWAFVEGKGWEEVKGANWQKPEGSASVFQTSRGEHPVVAVTWDDAVAFCRWAGKRLPTEAEWEYAARAGTTTQYWWGQGNPGTRLVENVADESAKHLLSVIMSGYNDGAVRTAPLGSYETNPWGLYDISGNVREWVADWYDENYYKNSPAHNPKGPGSGELRLLRGGSWGNEPVAVRSACRDGDTPTSRRDGIGFRCAQDVPK